MFTKARYFQVSLFRIRPGTEAEFGELIRLRRAAADAGNLDRPDLVYQVISGAPAGALVFLGPITPPPNFDEGGDPGPGLGEGVAKARAKEGSQPPSEA